MNLKVNYPYCPECVDNLTGKVDREREEFYWSNIREAQQQLEAIKGRPIPEDTPVMDYARVRDFLKNLYHNWNSCSPTSRNCLLKLIIEVVELKTIDYDIEATIIWKTGFRQKIIIHRPPWNSKMDKRWTEEEDGLLKMLYTSASASWPLKVALAHFD